MQESTRSYTPLSPHAMKKIMRSPSFQQEQNKTRQARRSGSRNEDIDINSLQTLFAPLSVSMEPEQGPRRTTKESDFPSATPSASPSALPSTSRRFKRILKCIRWIVVLYEKEDRMALVLHIAKETFCNEAEKK